MFFDCKSSTPDSDWVKVKGVITGVGLAEGLNGNPPAEFEFDEHSVLVKIHKEL